MCYAKLLHVKEVFGSNTELLPVGSIKHIADDEYLSESLSTSLQQFKLLMSRLMSMPIDAEP
jgi:hypothetical protein